MHTTGRGQFDSPRIFMPAVRGDIKIPLLKLVTFCRKTSNVCWWSFVDQLHPHHTLGSAVVTLYLVMSFC